MWPNQLGKQTEGDLEVNVDETKIEFLGLDEQLPCKYSEGHGGHYEETFKDIFEDDILRFAGTFEHRGTSPCDVRELITLREERHAREVGILEALRRNETATANPQHEASEIDGGPAGAGSATKGVRRKRRAKTKKRSGAGPPQRHGNGGRGQQLAPPKGASDKTSGKHIPPQRHGNGGRGQQLAPLQGASDKTSAKHISMHSSA